MTLTLIGISCLLVLTLFLSTIDVAFHYFSKIAMRNYSEENWKTEFLSHSLGRSLEPAASAAHRDSVRPCRRHGTSHAAIH